VRLKECKSKEYRKKNQYCGDIGIMEYKQRGRIDGICESIYLSELKSVRINGTVFELN
jgi:hypothetical protein